jgi:hypothetical protein
MSSATRGAVSSPGMAGDVQVTELDRMGRSDKFRDRDVAEGRAKLL